MGRNLTLAAALAALTIHAPAALAQPVADPAAEPDDRLLSRPASGADIFYSSDTDDTEIVRLGVDLDLRNRGPEDHLGLRVERAWYNPSGRGEEARDRIFLRAADSGGDWQWRARIGTDGDNVIGAISVNDRSPFRKEFFVERDIVETRQGLDRGIYSTFVGASIDLPVDDRNVFGAMVGAQAFTGDNVRLHAHGNYIHVLQPEWGLSAQLRGRYFSSSEPREFDYYSPRWYAELLPVLQLRRFVDGWELVGAGGYGVQRDSDSDWRGSRYLHARFRSPARSNWFVNGAVTWTNNPSVTSSAGSGYSYVQFSLGVSRRF